jgi:hypothetical protein
VEEFDAAQHFHTVPELLGRTYSRPKLQTLKSKAFVKIMDEQAIEVTFSLPIHDSIARLLIMTRELKEKRLLVMKSLGKE